MTTTGVLFVCLGNICRSPLAEGLFLHHAARRGVSQRFRVDSCGLGSWHIGKPADPRSIAVARAHGVPLPSRARLFEPASDPDAFEHIVAMDRTNRAALLEHGCPPGQVRLMLEFAPAWTQRLGSDDVPDPYYGGPEGFEQVYDMLNQATSALLDSLVRA